MCKEKKRLNKIFCRNGVTIIQLPDRLLDQFEIISAGETWMDAIKSNYPTQVVVSFDNVKCCGSEAIRLLLKLTQRIRQYGGEVKLCSMGCLVREVFDICQLIPNVFELHRSTADAVMSYAA